MPPPRRSSGSAQSSVVHWTTAEINVSQKHSLELAKTVMTATVSIFYLHRGNNLLTSLDQHSSVASVGVLVSLSE